MEDRVLKTLIPNSTTKPSSEAILEDLGVHLLPSVVIKSVCHLIAIVTTTIVCILLRITRNTSPNPTLPHGLMLSTIAKSQSIIICSPLSNQASAIHYKNTLGSVFLPSLVTHKRHPLATYPLIGNHMSIASHSLAMHEAIKAHHAITRLAHVTPPLFSSESPP
ncbi:FKBP-type peptidyl-prolyl cis-trans isomerase [Sesbania bispinosa]|nr:FKBP-type peptidyl-prolyl cis-trans isomerase [Sesbania bispinosa]